MKHFALILLCSFFAIVTFAQPKPGKESINIDLPAAYKWKKVKIKKDTKSIRGIEYSATGKNSADAPVQKVVITTIDRRYYPIKAGTTVSDKIGYTQSDCPEAKLTTVEQKTADKLTSIIYLISSETDDTCGDTIFLGYAIEGPTAFHTIDIEIAKENYSETLLDEWKAIFSSAIIK